MLRITGWAVVAVLLAAAAFELALALGAGSVGPEPGDGVAGEGVASVAAAVAMLAAVALGFVRSLRPHGAVPLLAPAAAAFLLTFFFTYDPYYAPALRRYANDGAVAFRWILFVTLLSASAGVLARLRPRTGSIATSIAVFVVFLTTAVAGDGH